MIGDDYVRVYVYTALPGASGSKTTIIRSDEASSNSDYGKPGMFGADLNASYYTIEQPYTLMYTTASQASYIIETARLLTSVVMRNYEMHTWGKPIFGEHLRTITY